MFFVVEEGRAVDMKANLINMRFGKLTVIQETGRSKKGSVVWECRCDCGQFTLASTDDLRSGHKKSCGCLKNISHAIDLKGKRFGKLVVEKRVGTSPDRHALWRCKCDCGKMTTVRSIDLVSGNTKSCGCLGKAYASRNNEAGGFWYEKGIIN